MSASFRQRLTGETDDSSTDTSSEAREIFGGEVLDITTCGRLAFERYTAVQQGASCECTRCATRASMSLRKPDFALRVEQ